MGYGQAAVLLLLLYYTDADVKMTGPSTYTATLGSNAHIPCTFTSDQNLMDSPQFAVFWYYNESVILGTDDSGGYNTSKYSMDKYQALNGIANLRISNISVADRGIYKCLVSYTQSQEQTITVTIQAVPKITVVNDDVMINKTSFLCCEISGFYPVDIYITWLRDGEPLANVLEGKLQNNPDGTYSINSSIILTFTEEDRKRNFSCRVHHVSLPTPLNKDLQLYIYGDEKMSNDYDDKVVTIILGCLFGLSVLAIIICCLLWKYDHNMLKKQIQDAKIPKNPDQKKCGENANEGEENDPQPEQNDAEEREGLKQEQTSTPRKRAIRQKDTTL
ncbi:natural cytotoxicity triggering receptor 3 ligand 1-like isoform X3 [Aquarana catesbeiana]|uniref:natural cytotoxicity triggering receptor 3 ligand 1-like isoform X2 n=1 Tax=Aquarana catesbeiana TaxID=8400 RepID=UPI003CC923EA